MPEDAGTGAAGTIPPDVRGALSAYLVRQGLPECSAEGLLDALATDMAEDVGGARGICAKLVAAATGAAAARVEDLVGEIARLASVPVAPGDD